MVSFLTSEAERGQVGDVAGNCLEKAGRQEQKTLWGGNEEVLKILGEV